MKSLTIVNQNGKVIKRFENDGDAPHAMVSLRFEAGIWYRHSIYKGLYLYTFPESVHSITGLTQDYTNNPIWVIMTENSINQTKEKDKI